MGGLSGFSMQQEGGMVDPGLAQPPGNLPVLKPDDAQYFGKLLVRTFNNIHKIHGTVAQDVLCKMKFKN